MDKRRWAVIRQRFRVKRRRRRVKRARGGGVNLTTSRRMRGKQEGRSQQTRSSGAAVCREDMRRRRDERRRDNQPGNERQTVAGSRRSNRTSPSSNGTSNAANPKCPEPSCPPPPPALGRRRADPIRDDDDGGGPSSGPRRAISSPRKFRRRSGAPELEKFPSVAPSRKRRRVNDNEPASKKGRDAIAADVRPWGGRSAAPVASPLICGAGTCPTSDDATRGDSLDPGSFGRSVECGGTEVPGFFAPASSNVAEPTQLGRRLRILSGASIIGGGRRYPSLRGPRRVTASPKKLR